MVRIFFKSSIQFLCFFLILSYPIKDRSLFSHMGQITQPYVNNFFEFVEDGIHKTIKKGKKFGRKLFSDSIPQKLSEGQLQNDEAIFPSESIDDNDSFISAFKQINQKKFFNAEKSLGSGNFLNTKWSRINQFLHSRN